MRRLLLGLVIMSVSATSAAVEPILLLLLRMARDQAISTSIERGVGAMRPESNPSTPVFGYMLPTEPVSKGTEEQRLRALIDDSFLHLTAGQRNAVFASVQKILNDPQHAQDKPLIVAEFTVKANAFRDSYRTLDKLSNPEKRRLAAQAKEEYRRLSSDDRRQMLDALQSGMLPMPRDLNAIMLAEFGTLAPVIADQRRLD